MLTSCTSSRGLSIWAKATASARRQQNQRGDQKKIQLKASIFGALDATFSFDGALVVTANSTQRS